MSLSDRLGERKDHYSESKDPESSFHGWLLDRSKTDLPDYTGQEKLTWLAEQWSSLGSAFGVGALVCGGLAIGAGVLLRGDGGFANSRSTMILMVGVASVLIGVLALLAQRLIVRWATEDVQD